MHVTFVETAADDTEAVRGQWERWLDRVRRHDGWLGATGGVTAGGLLVVASRFASPEQAAADDLAAFWPDAEIAQTDDIHLTGSEGLDAAGFVQLMRASVSDRAQLEDLEDGMTDAWAAHRPDFLGGYRAWLPAGELVAIDYFTSEAEARAGEAKPPPPELQAGFERWQTLMSDTRWYDIAEPWLASK